MRTRLAALIGVAAFAAGACGGDGGARQDEVADVLSTELEADSGLALDRECVRAAAAGISDDDAAAIIEQGLHGNPAISAESDLAVRSMGACVDIDQLVAMITDELGGGVDADCLRGALDGVDLVDLDTAVFGPDLAACLRVDG